jgi:hypothetical protein
MASKFRAKLDRLKEKAFNAALIPVEFALRPITSYFLRGMHLHQELAQDILITSDWTVIAPEMPMKIKKRFQEISFVLENCQQNFGKNRENLMFSDGTVINPAKQIVIEIFDEDGDKYELKSGSYSVGNFDHKAGRVGVGRAGFRSHKIALPRNKIFKEVRIRSDKTFRVKKIFWHDFNMK